MPPMLKCFVASAIRLKVHDEIFFIKQDPPTGITGYGAKVRSHLALSTDRKSVV